MAKAAGVSRSAVSRAFTPGASIAQETRTRVMQAAQKLGYQANDLARALLTRHSHLVGLVVTEPEVGFRAHLVAALTQALVQSGRIPVLINTGRSEEDILAAQRALLGYRPEATLVLSGSPPASFLDLARRHGHALILLGRSEEGAAHVRIDNAQAGRQAAVQFVTRGLRHLGVVGVGRATPSFVEREESFVAHARALGATVRVARGAEGDYAGGVEAARELLAPDAPIEGVFCVNDLLAFGLMDHVRDTLGWNIPHRLSVIGFDDVPQAAWASYRLTTFRQDPARMAAEVLRLLDVITAGAHGEEIDACLVAPLVLRATLRPA
ncbi:MAG: LacI family DNA-binding transcriptional regulator [Rhodocyclaceae bacterium]